MINESQRKKVLVIDDEPDIREIVSQILSEKYQVYLSPNAEEGLLSAKDHHPSVVLLDLRMPGVSGIEACRRLRNDQETRNIPVVMLTASDELSQRIAAFDAGADDFVSKPFSPEELMARVNSKVRRAQDSFLHSETCLIFGDLKIFPSELKAVLSNETLGLSPSEFKVLVALVKADGQLVSREALSEVIWGMDSDSRSLDPLMSALRKKLKDSHVDVKTVYRAGYSLIQKRI